MFYKLILPIAILLFLFQYSSVFVFKNFFFWFYLSQSGTAHGLMLMNRLYLCMDILFP